MHLFKGKKVLITEGLGFVGSKLSIKLVELGAKVLIIDNMLPQQDYKGTYIAVIMLKHEI